MSGIGSVRDSSLTRIESIAGAPHGDDVARPGWVGFNLLSQTSDVHRDRTPISEGAPDQLEELISTEHATRLFDEDAQQFEFSCCEFDFSPLPADLVRCKVDFELSDVQRSGLIGR